MKKLLPIQALPPLRVHGLVTFAGALEAVWADISADWSVETQARYQRYYALIIAALSAHDMTPICTYHVKDYEDAIEALRISGYVCKGEHHEYDSDTTAETFERLIRVVVTAASSKYLTKNVFLVASCPEHHSHPNRNGLPIGIVPRSLSESQAKRLIAAIMTDPAQAGERMGLALQWGLSCRNAEAAALNFGDIVPLKDFPEACIARFYKSTIGNSNDVKFSGKTRNAARPHPVYPSLLDLILRRRQLVQDELGSDCDIDMLPIACRGHEYCIRCSSPDLTRAARSVFDQIGITESDMIGIQTLIQAEQESYQYHLGIYGTDAPERSATAYLLRRDGLNRLAYAGVPIAQIQAICGHLITASDDFLRSDLVSDETMLYDIWKKMAAADLALQTGNASITMALASGTEISIEGTDADLEVPEDFSEMTVSITPLEPTDTLHIDVSSETDDQISCRFAPSDAPLRKEVSVAEDRLKLQNFD